MPQNIAIASFVLGAVLILIALLRGGFKIFGAEISGTTGGLGRIIAFALGLFFVFIGVVLGLVESFGLLQPFSATESPESPVILPTSIPENLLPPSDTTILEPEVPPANYSCPELQGASWLSSPGIWYGPNEWNGITYSISYDQYYIYAWNSYDNNVTSYPDPAAYGGRNQWIPLSGAPYTICVDTSGNVYATFTP